MYFKSQTIHKSLSYYISILYIISLRLAVLCVFWRRFWNMFTVSASNTLIRFIRLFSIWNVKLPSSHTGSFSTSWIVERNLMSSNFCHSGNLIMPSRSLRNSRVEGFIFLARSWWTFSITRLCFGISGCRTARTYSKWGHTNYVKSFLNSCGELARREHWLCWLFVCLLNFSFESLSWSSFPYNLAFPCSVFQYISMELVETHHCWQFCFFQIEMRSFILWLFQ